MLTWVLRQGLYTSWVDDPPGNCPDPVSPCLTKQGGRFCPVRQPDWSAYRYDSVQGTGFRSKAHCGQDVWDEQHRPSKLWAELNWGSGLGVAGIWCDTQPAFQAVCSPGPGARVVGGQLRMPVAAR